MKNDQATLQPIRLADYTPPAYRIETVDLRFDLDPATTRVTRTMRVRRNAAAPGNPLVLDGEHLDLISMAIDEKLGPDAYRTDDGTLTVPGVPEKFELTVVTETHRKDTTALEGLDQSSGNSCTQCEAGGFGRITYFLDRPDVLTTDSTTIVADKTNYPVLLSNGNPVGAGDLDDALEAEALTLPSAEAIGRRRLKKLCLGCRERNEYIQLAIDQINVERNMTDIIAGLRVLSRLDIPEREHELNDFYEKWKDDPLVTDNWLALQATAKRENVIEDVKALIEHPAFNRRNLNGIRSLIRALPTGNFEGFHRADRAGYSCWRIS